MCGWKVSKKSVCITMLASRKLKLKMKSYLPIFKQMLPRKRLCLKSQSLAQSSKS